MRIGRGYILDACAERTFDPGFGNDGVVVKRMRNLSHEVTARVRLLECDLELLQRWITNGDDVELVSAGSARVVESIKVAAAPAPPKPATTVEEIAKEVTRFSMLEVDDG